VNRARARRLGGTVIVGTLIAFQLFAGSAGAAVPSGTATVTAIPARFTAGNDVGFRATFALKAGETSTLSKLFLVLKVTGVDENTYLSATRNGANATKSCVMGVPVTCTFKSFRPGENVVVTAGFNVTDGIETATGDAIFSTSGSSERDGGTSHGDTWVDEEGAASSVLTDDPNYGGGFSSILGSTIQNGQVVTALNRQATKLAALPAGVAATVLDGGAATGSCGPYDCSSSIGEWSEVTVGDGQPFGSPFQIQITFYQGTPKSFVHQYVDSTGTTQYELVGACPKKSPGSAAPCFTWTANISTATIFTLRNGSWKGL